MNPLITVVAGLVLMDTVVVLAPIRPPVTQAAAAAHPATPAPLLPLPGSPAHFRSRWGSAQPAVAGSARTAPSRAGKGAGQSAVPETSLPPSTVSGAVAGALACIRAHESDTAGGYRAVSADGQYRGAYQLSVTYSPAWARRYGHPDVAGLPADQWPPAVQDDVAAHLYLDFPQAWAGDGC